MQLGISGKEDIRVFSPQTTTGEGQAILHSHSPSHLPQLSSWAKLLVLKTKLVVDLNNSIAHSLGTHLADEI